MAIFKKRMIGIIVTSFMFSLSQQATAETLRDAVAKTVNSNPDVRIAAKIRSASNETVYEARAGYFPTLDLNAGYGREQAKNLNTNQSYNTLWRRDFGVTARQMLFDGFATYHEVKRTKAKTNADAYKVWGQAEDSGLAAVQAYLDVLRNQELVNVARRNVDTHTHTYGMIRKMSEQGLGREADSDQTAGRVELARANLKTAQLNLENAKINFQKVTGCMPHFLARVPDVRSSALPRSEHEALRRALQNHPILKSAVSDIREARGQHEASKAAFYPRLDLVLADHENRNVNGVRGPNIDRSIMLQAQYNLLRGGHDVARTRETAYEVQHAAEIRNRTERQVIESMRLSWTAYEISRSRIPLLVQHRNDAISTTSAYKKQFELNKRTILDVLDSQNEYFTAEQDVINERYALLFAKYRILNSEGRLVEYLCIPLPPEAIIPYPYEDDMYVATAHCGIYKDMPPMKV